MGVDVAYFAETRGRFDGIRFGLKQRDRLLHLYAIGKTGVGKTTLLETLIRSDLSAGRGFALIDPHGDLSGRIAAAAGDLRPGATTVIDIANPDLSLGYNPLVRVSAPLRPLLAAGVLDVLKKMWPDAWGVRMEHMLRNALLALLDQPAADFRDILRLLNDKTYRAEVIANIENEQVRVFWKSEFPRYSLRYAADAVAPIQNKSARFSPTPGCSGFSREKTGPFGFAGSWTRAASSS